MEQRSESETLPTLAAIILARASVTVSRNLSEALENNHGLHISQFDVMATLQRLNRTAGVPLHELASQMAVTPASMTNRVDNLADKGYVERIPCPNDRRSWHIKMTPKGKTFFGKVFEEHRRNEASQFEGLTDAEKKELISLLVKLLDAVE